MIAAVGIGECHEGPNDRIDDIVLDAVVGGRTEVTWHSTSKFWPSKSPMRRARRTLPGGSSGESLVEKAAN